MFKIILLLLIQSLAHINEVFGAEDELLSVVAVFRHGDRTPTDFPPTDNYQNLSYWPTEPGELTNIGKTEHFELGKWLRKRYYNFLSTTYHKDDIYIRASNTDRCLMSAEANLAGLFPPVDRQIWNEDLKWMPIPIHTVPSKDDNLLKMGKACPNMKQKYKALLNNDHFKDIDKKNSKLYDFLSEKLGLQIEKFSDIEAPYDTMTVEVEYKLEQPEWTNTPWGEDNHKLFPDEMKIWADLSYQTPTYNQELARLGTGRFFDTVASHFQSVLNKNTEELLAKKMALFFGHKSTICDLTHTLGTFRLASYASSLIFELWKSSTDQTIYVTLNYLDNMNPEKLTIAGCTENCAFEKFLAILEPIRMNKTVWKQECKGNGAHKIASSITVISPAILVVIYYLV
ncbi:testicular acid phosphatase homolog isoform X1 [Harmonia axyridis]|uniref:testicular acid phosphatase homolog isoform X1 n=1 Tax=Harmonia axyridis TaxID=115357 RepID=UPI001E278138|nr:testicular acid phosphatase homolog isoform X1 [Harmonia axyridis]XP_045465620.1 testicular acid phosphatase homolog isoform X1 [Harmonia axyridis]